MFDTSLKSATSDHVTVLVSVSTSTHIMEIKYVLLYLITKKTAQFV